MAWNKPVASMSAVETEEAEPDEEEVSLLFLYFFIFIFFLRLNNTAFSKRKFICGFVLVFFNLTHVLISESNFCIFLGV